jgi:DNA primase
MLSANYQDSLRVSTHLLSSYHTPLGVIADSDSGESAADIKRRVDLLALVGRDTDLRKKANTRGGEYAGPCPFCGGKDRFLVQPERGVWHCRHCCADGRWPDAIEYVRRRDGVTFTEAVARLGNSATVGRFSRPVNGATVTPLTAEPSSTWRAAGTALMERAEAALWGEAGRKARVWLHERGLSKATLKVWRLGFIPEDGYDAPEAWGFDPAERRRVLVPAGIVIPWFHEGRLWQLKVRRRSGCDPKYLSVAGGHPLAYGLHTLKGHRIALACEGEFDAMLAHQEAGALMGVFSLGSCEASLDARAVPYLLPLVRVLVSFDNDEPGQRGAAKLAARSERMRIVTVPRGHNDITDYWRQGGDVVGWLCEEAGTHWPEPFVPVPPGERVRRVL